MLFFARFLVLAHCDRASVFMSRPPCATPATLCTSVVCVIVLMLHPCMVTAKIGAGVHTQEYVPVLDCDRAEYLQCPWGFGANEGCCGEGYENRYWLQCTKCTQGKYKGGLYDECINCPTGKMQAKVGCSSCYDCTSTCIVDLLGLATDTKLKNDNKAFDLKACASDDQCSPQRHTSPCSSEEIGRLTVAVMPEGWTTLEDSGTECTTGEVQKCIVLRPDSKTEYQAKPLTCLVPTSKTCVHNAESYSWLPCSLVNSNNCESVKTIADAYSTAAKAAAESPASAIWHATPIKTGASLVMRVPTGFDLTVTLFSDNLCNNPVEDSEKKSSVSERNLEWPTSGNEFFRIAIAAESTRRCSCDPEVGAFPPQGDGVAVTSVTCNGNCAKGQILKHIENTCDFDFKECVWCPRHHHYDDTNGECGRCPDERPHREAKDEDECRACGDSEYFQWLSYMSLDVQGCTALKNMTVDTAGGITDRVDEYRSGPFEKKNTPTGSYRINFTDTAACDARSKVVCNESGTYLHGCIGRIPDNNEFYVKTTASNVDEIVHYKIAFPDTGPHTTYTNVDVRRQGQCRPCIKCSDNEYLAGCLFTDSDHKIFPGVGWETHDQNKGQCMPCGDHTLLSDDQYFWHPQPGNCSDWTEGGEISTKPWETKDCAAVITSTNQDRVLLSAGCNKNEFKWWSTDRVTSGQDSARSVPGSRTCSHMQEGLSDIDCNIPDFIGTNTPSTPVTWSAYAQQDIRMSPATEDVNFRSGGGTARVAYCPPGWHVDLECALGTQVWSKECCRECRECRLENLEKRSQHWVACDGSTTADTQSFCQASCDVGYYEKKISDANGNYSSCTPCELC